MFRITNNKIELTRGDKAIITLRVSNYTFKVGDTISFRVYNKGALEKEPLITEIVNVNEESESVSIVLSNITTKIGEMGNKPVTYWYEISLNNETTVLGFDDKGGKELILYPEGKDVE